MGLCAVVVEFQEHGECCFNTESAEFTENLGQEGKPIRKSRRVHAFAVARACRSSRDKARQQIHLPEIGRPGEV